MWTFLTKEGSSIPVCDAAVLESEVLSTLIKDIENKETIIPVTEFTEPVLILYNSAMMFDDIHLIDYLMQISHRELAALYNLADFLHVSRLCNACPTAIQSRLAKCEDLAEAIDAYFGSLISGAGKKFIGQAQA